MLICGKIDYEIIYITKLIPFFSYDIVRLKPLKHLFHYDIIKPKAVIE